MKQNLTSEIFRCTTLKQRRNSVVQRCYNVISMFFQRSLNVVKARSKPIALFFFYLGFLLRSFIIHRTAREGGGHFFKCSLPLPPASQSFRLSRAITAESSLLHIASSRTRTRNLWFLGASR